MDQTSQPSSRTSPATVEEFIAGVSDGAQAELAGLAAIVLDIEVLGSVISWTASARRHDGAWEASRVLTSLGDASSTFEAAKVDAYTKGYGTWFMCRATLRHGVAPDIQWFGSDRP